MIFILAIQTAIADDTAVTEETPSVPPQATVVSSPDQAPDFSEVVQLLGNVLAQIDEAVPIQKVTFDADRLNRLGFGDDISDAFALVPGQRFGSSTLGGHSRSDVAVMLDGVTLRNHKALGPMP
jgi:outer membrane receptor protein involved in Fe transport